MPDSVRWQWGGLGVLEKCERQVRFIHRRMHRAYTPHTHFGIFRKTHVTKGSKQYK